MGVVGRIRHRPHESSDAPTDWPLRIAITRRGGVNGTQLCLRVAGDVDLVTSATLADALERARQDLLSSRGPVEMVVDLRDVKFLSVSGVRVLVNAYDGCQENAIVLRVAADHSAVTRPLLLTGVNARLDLRSCPDAAPGT